MVVVYRLLLTLLLAAGAVLAIDSQLPLVASIVASMCIAAAVFISPLLAQTAAPRVKAGGSKADSTKTGGGSANRETGEVKWFNTSKGFGFITRTDGSDVFVHFRAIRGEGHRALREGQRVSYTVTHGEKGPQAEDVDILDR